MNFTIKMSNSEVDKIFDIANSASKKEVSEMMNALKSGATYDFGGIAISHPESNIFEVSLNPHFSNFILSGPIMDIISFIPAIERMAKGLSEHMRSPIVVKYNDSTIEEKVEINDSEDYDDDYFDDEDDTDCKESELNYCDNINTDNVSTNFKIKPKHEYAIFNV